jgi:hypothetical protein
MALVDGRVSTSSSVAKPGEKRKVNKSGVLIEIFTKRRFNLGSGVGRESTCFTRVASWRRRALWTRSSSILTRFSLR